MTLKTSSKFKSLLKALPALALLVGALQLSGSPATAEGDLTVYSHQVIRLYRTTLGRSPDVVGLNYWTSRLSTGESAESVARGFIDSPESVASTTGDPILDAYSRALGRTPDQSGYDYWSRRILAEAVVAISDSAEHVQLTGTMAAPAPRPTAASVAAAPQGWVDAGHGVHVPPVMLRIRNCESRNNYQAANRWSTARGAYQFLKSSWKLYGHAARYGVAEAHLATNAQQDEAAVLTWQRSGTSPWNASAGCWR